MTFRMILLSLPAPLCKRTAKVNGLKSVTLLLNHGANADVR